MKFIHTSDWHIGKIVNQVYMTEDQAYVLKQLIQLLAVEKPDALIIAGDIYDRAVPPVEAVELLDWTLSQILLELKIPVLAIAGNHDSPDRVGFGSDLLRSQGLYIAGRLQKKIEKVTLFDESGPVHFYLVPYAPPAVVREVLANSQVTDHNTAMQEIVQQLKPDLASSERQVLITHGFVRGSVDPELSESEKPLSLGGTDFVALDHFAAFSYTALGHLHGAQQVGSQKVRYAGSLLKYSFSEVKQQKSVTVVEIDGQGQVEVRLCPLKPKRDMRVITADLEVLLNPEFADQKNFEDYLRVILTDSGEILDPMNKLRALYPNVMELERSCRKQRPGDSRTAAGEGYRTKDCLHLFQDFYSQITGEPWTEAKSQVIAQVIEQVADQERRS